MDRIGIKGLVVETRIGVTETERSRLQDVVIDVDLTADLAAAGGSDDISDTIDYEMLTDRIAELVRTSECNLLERLATKIADLVATIPRVSGVTVVVMKQHAPVDEEVSAISVTVTRGDLQ